MVAMEIRLVVPTSSRVPDRVLERAIRHAAAAGGRVHVVIPVVLPASLPIGAAPARLMERIESQREVARRALLREGRPPLVEVARCRTVASLMRAWSKSAEPAEIVLAGGAPWRLRRLVRALATATVISSRSSELAAPQPLRALGDA